MEDPVTEAAIRDIADGLLIEVMGERIDLGGLANREPTGHPLLISASTATTRSSRAPGGLLHALDSLHVLAEDSPRMLRMWSASDDQVVA